MSFLSIEFSLIFPLFFLIYWLSRNKPTIQNVLLLIASYALVAYFNINYLAVLVGYTALLYLISFPIFYSKYRIHWLVVALIIATVNLCFFKYFDFFRTQLQTIINALELHYVLPGIEIFLPIGISFYTFHSISYLVSLKKKEISFPTPLNFALYLAFFPSLIAGPINRAKNFLPQIQVTTPRTIGNYNQAFVLILLALIKVLCLNTLLADNFVDPVFATPSNYQSLDILLAIYAYALQIYFNFSGYTNLVTAIALLLGFTLPENFNMPYFATNLRDFWQRWHISLSTWIKDYVYIPLGGNRKGFKRTQINLFIAMVLSGLWHGANYTFILWGVIHAIGIVGLNVSDKYLGKSRLTTYSPLCARLATFHYVCFAWIFFRNPTLADTKEFFSALTHNITNTPLTSNVFLYFPLLLIVFITYPQLAKLPKILATQLDRIHWSALPFIWVIILYIVFTIAPSGIPNFIYAKF